MTDPKTAMETLTTALTWLIYAGVVYLGIAIILFIATLFCIVLFVRRG